MNYPNLAESLESQLSTNEWNVISTDIRKVDDLAWHQNDQACRILEAAAEKAIACKYYRCAARVLWYYDKFFAEG